MTQTATKSPITTTTFPTLSNAQDGGTLSPILPTTSFPATSMTTGTLTPPGQANASSLSSIPQAMTTTTTPTAVTTTPRTISSTNPDKITIKANNYCDDNGELIINNSSVAERLPLVAVGGSEEQRDEGLLRRRPPPPSEPADRSNKSNNNTNNTNGSGNCFSNGMMGCGGAGGDGMMEQGPKNKPLQNWNEMPRHLQFNPYVLTGYRPLQSLHGCISSLFYMHNETINILTHGKWILMIVWVIWVFWKVLLVL